MKSYNKCSPNHIIGGWVGGDVLPWSRFVSFRSLVRVNARSGCRVGIRPKRARWPFPGPFCPTALSLFPFVPIAFSLFSCAWWRVCFSLRWIRSEIEVKTKWNRSEEPKWQIEVNSKWSRSESINRSEIKMKSKWDRSETEVALKGNPC